MKRKLSHIAPHAAILICNMYVVFFLIDRVNQAMNFIDNGLTKGLLLILCAVALFNAWVLLKPTLDGRRRPAGRGSARPARPAQYADRNRRSRPAPVSTRYSGSGNARARREYRR